MVALGIEQQYDYTAHMTLGYFNDIPPDLDRGAVVETLATINEQWRDSQLPVLTVKQAQLRYFPDMIHYQRETDWPVVTF